MKILNVEKILESRGDLSETRKLKQLASEEEYINLLDDYIDGIDVKIDKDGVRESISDYLKRNDFKGIGDLASDSSIEEIELSIQSDLSQWPEYKKQYPNKTYDEFLEDIGLKKISLAGGGSVDGNGLDKKRPFTQAVEKKYKILLSGDETLEEVLEKIRKIKLTGNN